MIWNMRRKRGKMLTVELSGWIGRSTGYVVIDGTVYRNEQTVKVAKGARVTVRCSGVNTTNSRNCLITLNGEVVANGTPNGASYTFTVTDNCSIWFSRYATGTYYNADITMPA
mgnify:CR=1 FL=1